jgi:hypothetical protein
MPTTKTLDKESALWAISDQRLGYEFGQPERVDDNSLAAVLPILRHSITGRSYLTFPETDKLKVHDSGSIAVMKAKNEGAEAIFLRSGTIFKGSTQERTSLRSMVILPGLTVEVPVRCIHASRPITSNAKVQYGGVSPLAMDQMVYTAAFTASDQHTYWNSAKTVSCNMLRMSGKPVQESRFDRGYGELHTARGWTSSAGFNGEYEGGYSGIVGGCFPSSVMPDQTATDDLSSHYEQFSQDMDKLLSKVTLHDDQVGLALINEKGCQTLEVFDAFASWKALHEDAVKRLGPSMAAKDTGGVFEYRPDKAIKVVQDLLALPFQEKLIYEHKPNGTPGFTVTALTAERYTGEVVELDGHMIHLMLLQLA